MIRLNRAQRELFAQRATELGNFAVTALLLGQLIAGQFRLDWTLLGILVGVIMYVAGAALLREGRDARG